MDRSISSQAASPRPTQELTLAKAPFTQRMLVDGPLHHQERASFLLAAGHDSANSDALASPGSIVSIHRKLVAFSGVT